MAWQLLHVDAAFVFKRDEKIRAKVTPLEDKEFIGIGKTKKIAKIYAALKRFLLITP